MAEKYTEAQHKAIQNYRKDKSTVTLTVTQEEKQLIQSRADARGLSVKKYIMELVRADQ